MATDTSRYRRSPPSEMEQAAFKAIEFAFTNICVSVQAGAQRPLEDVLETQASSTWLGRMPITVTSNAGVLFY